MEESLARVTAVLLVGGMGRRLRAVVQDRPKPLADVLGRPFLTYLLEQLADLGITRVVLCSGYRAGQIAELGKSYRGMELLYSVEPSPLGTAGALRLARPLLASDPVLVMNGDSYVDTDLSALWQFHRAQRNSAGTLLLTQVPDGARFGSVDLNHRGYVTSFREKAVAGRPALVSAGIYLLRPRTLDAIPPFGEVSLERQVFPTLTGHGGLIGMVAGARFLDIGTPESYGEAETFFAEKARALEASLPAAAAHATADAPSPRRCRICKGEELVRFLDLGLQPHCNSFLRPEDVGGDEPRWPLDLYYCKSCHLVQLGTVVDPAQMFRHYLYVSGTTRTLTEHFKASAQTLVGRFEPPPGALVVDIGSNDGTWLQQFKDLGLRTVGVDPATNIAAQANARGIETVNEFFTEEVARKIRAEKGPATLITAAGVFFHIDDMDDVCRGIAALLDDHGVLHVQAIYLGAMLEQTSYDNVYHEHVSYYTLHPLIVLFERFGLEVFDVGFSPIHGGSLMLYVAHKGARPVQPSVGKQLAFERAQGWDTLAPYLAFAERVQKNRDDLRRLIAGLRAEGKRVAAFTAPAKGNTLLNYCGLGPDLLEYACERAPLKIGLLTPGTHLPVIDEAQAMKHPPDYFLMLAWNFKDELIEKNRSYLQAGGRFVVPIPEPQVVG